ncbi:hypothetical protein ACM4Z8_11300 [Escherichia coli]|uniref:hypothetical protein n=1 Tax=Escherichia coli TaxID=562 RepID=UPI0020001C3F|nr:hypothetical protein [Escherichia coli]
MSIWGSPPTGIFFRLNVNQAGGLYLFGRCYDYRNTFPQWGKSSNRNDVRYGCLDDLRGHYDHSDNALNQNFSLKNDVDHVARKAQNPVDF